MKTKSKLKLALDQEVEKMAGNLANHILEELRNSAELSVSAHPDGIWVYEAGEFIGRCEWREEGCSRDILMDGLNDDLQSEMVVERPEKLKEYSNRLKQAAAMIDRALKHSRRM